MGNDILILSLRSGSTFHFFEYIAIMVQDFYYDVLSMIPWDQFTTFVLIT